ncbi:DUF397 domain-containing protein [Goodfellowiella coeruleoviolacea]|uniref:DUF397 domain-containing protein n=1 Tax=Goodfellowiella coeruleoviolacea TaxID=334858 RepID=A0AAE3GKB7_9PSEU|nr:DUF397 domain-containing protein [Goodfellowiella coeruleoviolacea]MCP2169847.1 protein of unknown function (DUF397) [Goodfellowiella coeruleoviolacea]
MSQSTWRRSSYSNGPNNNCLEVFSAAISLTGVRDSKNPATEIWISRTAWADFLARAKDGAHDRAI